MRIVTTLGSLALLLSLVPAASAEELPFRLGDLQASRLAMSPNGDGSGDAVEFSYTLSHPANVEVTVQAAGGVVARSVWSGATGAGLQELAWDGWDNAGVPVADGSYALVVRAVATNGVVATQRLPLLVDTVAPAPLNPPLAHRHRDDVRAFPVAVSISEPSLVTSVIADGDSTYTAQAVRTPGAQSLSVRTADRFYLRRVRGAYRVTLRATDTAGNSVEGGFPVSVFPRPRAVEAIPPSPLPRWLRRHMYRATFAARVPQSWVSSRGLYNIIRRESSFNPRAQNPTSSAYGLFQFLDSTWATVGGHKTSDPYLQSVYGLRYIKRRYRTPEAAWRFWLAHHWYRPAPVMPPPPGGELPAGGEVPAGGELPPLG